jgi:protease-4
MNVAQVDELGQGRIWTGAQAQQRKLVDRLGDFNDAVGEARQLVNKRAPSASAAATPLPIRYLGPKVSAIDAVVDRYLPKSQWLLGDGQLKWLQVLAGNGPATPVAQLGVLGDDLLWLQDVLSQSRPFAAVAHCMCQLSP